MDDGDVAVLLDERREIDGTVLRVKALAVPESETFPTGIKYRFHYGRKDGKTLVRYDNSHGTHERHTPKGREVISFPGLPTLYQRFKREVERHD